MTDREAKNRRTAEALEPVASLPQGKGYLTSSPLKAWRTADKSGSDGPPYGSWQPRDFDTDEAASALLLEAMPLVILGHAGDFRDGKAAIHGAWTVSAKGNVYVVNADRKLAIRDAFLAWLDATENL